MVKECRVILNNDVLTVVRFDDIDIQFPSIGKDVETVFVKHENDRYTIVDEKEKNDTVEKPKRKVSKKKTTLELEKVDEINDSKNE